MVSKYMQTNVITVSPSATLKEAVALMLKHHTNGLVAVDAEQKVAGILSSWDIIEYIVPDYLEEEGHLSSFESGDVLFERARELAEHPVSRFMTKKVHCVKSTDKLMEAATLLSEFRIRQLPVVDDDGKLVGYINRTDIKRAIGDALNITSK